MKENVRISNLVESIAQAALATDRQGRIVYANPAAVAQCGLSEPELRARSLGDVFRLDGEQRRTLEHCARSGEAASFETEVCCTGTGTGRAVQLAVSGMRSGDSSGGLMVVATDITERRRAETDLRESRLALSTLLSNLPGMAYRCADDMDWTMEYVSEGCLPLTGYPQADMEEKRILYNDLIVPEDRRYVWDGVRQAVEAGHPFTLTYRIKPRGAAVKWVWEQGRMVEGHAGRPVALEGFITDISDRMRAEESLRESETRFRDIVEGADHLVTQTDGQGRYLYVNRASERILGRPVSQSIGRSAFADVYPEDRNRTREAFAGWIARHQETATFENRIVSTRGDVHSILWTIALHFDPQGRLTTVNSFGNDVTERQRAQEELAHREAKLRSLFLGAPIGIGVVAGRVFEEVNERFCQMLRYECDELLGRNTRILYATQEEYDRVGRTVYTEMTALGTGSIETQWRRKDGTVMDALLGLTPLDKAELSTGVVFTAMDITARKQAEAALRDSEARVRAVVDSSPLGMLMYDLREDGVLVLTGANPAADRILKIDCAALAGQIIEKAFPALDTTELPEAFRRVALTGQPWHTEESVYDDGVIRGTYEVHVFQALPGRIVVAFQDVTDRKRLEDQLRQATKMEAIGLLAGGVAHDFNNQLTVIKGYTDLLIHGPQDPAQTAESLQEISWAAARAERLTSQLLAFSRRQVLRPEVLDLNEVISEMANPLSRVIGETIEFSVVLSPPLGHVRVDRTQVEQVIMNLVINARDAMPGGGKVTIETVDLTLDGEYAQAHPDAQNGPYVMLAVTDTGIGMDTVTRQRIFEPFYTTKEVGKGTGLGLAMVYGFVKQSGGLIYVYSEPGHGTTFKIYLPRVSSDAAPREAAETAGESCRGSETVLVVEDDEAVRNFLVRVLRRNGYTVLECSRAAEALAQDREHVGRIDLLITDVVMPQMGGADLARRFQAVRPETKVLFISGYTENAIVHHGELDKGVNLLTKPFSADELARMVCRVLVGNRKT